jgi:SepF-like predicted cell division protein (DUF552 family)
MPIFADLNEKLLDAVEEGDIAKVKELLKKGSDPNARDHGPRERVWRYGKTPLCLAVEHGHTEIVKLLIEHGADVNASCYIDSFETPLHQAVVDDDTEIAKLLIQNGADVNARRSFDGLTPLHLAASGGYSRMVRLLLENGADPSIRDNFGKTASERAREEDHEEVASIIEGFMGKSKGKSSSKTKRKLPVKKVEEEREEILLNVPFELDEDDSTEFILGRIEAGDIINVEVDADSENIYILTISIIDGKRNLLSTRVKGGSTLSYKVPFSCEASIILKCSNCSGEPEGTLTVNIARASHKAPRCPKCGMPLEPGAKYCGYCGAKVA